MSLSARTKGVLGSPHPLPAPPHPCNSPPPPTQDPGKVWKGKKMPGRMGGERRTVQNCLVYKVGL